jgi:very-short-patch-repair endonuclease
MKRTPPDGSTQRARRLRNEMTDAERKIWTLLRTAFPDWRFRRQVPIRQYIADFASHRARLVIEIYGGQHNEEIDAPRTAIIESDGYRVVRFWNNDVLANIDGVATLLTKALDETSPPPNPPPSRGRALEDRPAR